MADVKTSDFSIDSTIAGTERLLKDAAGGEVILVSAISTYTIAQLLAAAEVTPTASDAVLMERAGTKGTFDLDDLASYCVASAWSVATPVTPAATGDSLLVQRGSTVYDMNVDTLVTYVLTTTAAAATPLQAGVLNTSALGSATLVATDLIPICPVGAPTVPKTVALSALETKLWADFATYVGALTEVASAVDSNKFYVLEGSSAKYVDADTLADYMSAEIIDIGNVQTAACAYLDTYLTALDAAATVNDTDLFYVTQSGVAKKMTALQVANYAVNNAFELPWKEIPSAYYTHSDPAVTTPASTSTINMTNTSDVVVGSPVKYVYGGLTYYGIVTAVSANSLITIAGAPLVVLSSITALYVGTPDMVTQMDFLVEDTYGDAAQDIFSAISYERHRWGKSAAYLVQFSAAHGVVDTGAAQPKLNVKINDIIVSTNDVSRGLQLSAVAGTWTDSSEIAIDTATYKIERGEAIELRCTAAGTNGDADVLSVTCIFVSE
jgi:hypothetical protein